MHGTLELETTFTGECLRKSFAFDELHSDEVATVGKCSGVEDHCSVSVAELRHSFRLAQKTFSYVMVSREFALDDFDCDRTVEPKVGSQVDRSHATCSDLSFDPEPAGDKLRDIHK
jgi:hypothetical protein